MVQRDSQAQGGSPRSRTPWYRNRELPGRIMLSAGGFTFLITPIGVVVGLVLGNVQSWQLGMWVGGGLALGPLVLGSVVAVTLEVVAALYRGLASMFDFGRREPLEPPPKPKPPRVAGALAPDRPLGIDFGKPYDFYFSRHSLFGHSVEE